MMRRRWVASIGWLVTLLTLGAMIAPVALAQDATPASPAGGGEVVQSVTREEVASRLFEQWPLEEVGSPGGQVIWGDSTDLTTLNALLVDSSPTSDIVGLVSESLIGVSPIDGTIIPGLADSYEIAADGVTYTFNLNTTAAWHDGTDFTADDVVFSFDAVLNPELNSAYTSTVDQVLESYRAVDADTIEMVSDGPRATFLYDAAGTPIVPKHVWEGVAIPDWAADPGSTGEDPSRVVGTGPFKFQGREIGATATFVKNEQYWDTVTGQVPNIDEFIYQVLPDDAAAVQALITGASDILVTIPAPQTEDVENTEGLAVEIYTTLDFTYYGLQLDPERTTLFQDVEVRQALFHALDRQAIVDTIYAGFGEVATGTQSTLSPAYAPDEINTIYDYNPDRARELLEQAGWVDTNDDGTVDKDGQELAFTMEVPQSSTGDQLAVYFQEAWAEIGVSMTPNIIPFETLVDETGPIETRDFESFLLGFGWDPDGGQGAMFTCDGGFNYSGYCNPRYDELEEQQLTTLDPEARRQILIEQSNIVNDEQAVSIFRFAVGRTGYSERIHNFHPTAYSFLWSLPFVWVEQE